MSRLHGDEGFSAAVSDRAIELGASVLEISGLSSTRGRLESISLSLSRPLLLQSSVGA